MSWFNQFKRVIGVGVVAVVLLATLATAAVAFNRPDDVQRLDAFDEPVWAFVDSGSFGGSPDLTWAAVDAGSLDPVMRHRGGSGARVQ